MLQLKLFQLKLLFHLQWKKFHREKCRNRICQMQHAWYAAISSSHHEKLLQRKVLCHWKSDGFIAALNIFLFFGYCHCDMWHFFVETITLFLLSFVLMTKSMSTMTSRNIENYLIRKHNEIIKKVICHVRNVKRRIKMNIN